MPWAVAWSHGLHGLHAQGLQLSAPPHLDEPGRNTDQREAGAAALVVWAGVSCIGPHDQIANHIIATGDLSDPGYSCDKDHHRRPHCHRAISIR